MTTPGRDASRELSGLELAREWAKLPPEHLKAALAALEPELKRTHARKMKELDMQQREREAAHEAEERQAERSYRLYMGGLVAGFALCAGMLCGSVIEALHKQEMLAGILAGPTMIGVVALFVLRQRQSGRGQQRPGRASIPGQQPPSAPPVLVPTPEAVEPA
ncbi:hypothetical protein ACFRMQ_26695 [Kitasatospora sp. NPDC056783]|uniref:hypothetical protein n=1 Tax=Kitasatospora sp. NPDC056783 TaxID=3345943 RepID=UPI00367E07F7